MKNILLIIAALIVNLMFVIYSCTREDASIIEPGEQVIQDEKEAVIEAVLARADDQINREISMLEKYNYTISGKKSVDAEAEPCDAFVVVDTPENSKFPKTITLDYGQGCTDPEGNFRAGKIIVHITGPYWAKNTVRHARLVDYIYNDLKITGDRHEINKGQDEKGFYTFDLKHSEKIWTTGGEFLVERDWSKIRTYNRGSDRKTTTDDEVWISGKGKVEKSGRVTIKEITEPLYRPVPCKHFQSGIITTYVKKEKLSELDYGVYIPGECENTAVWTNGKVTKTIVLQTGINYFRIKN